MRLPVGVCCSIVVILMLSTHDRAAFAQAPTTLAEFKAIIDQASATALEVKKVDEKMADAVERGKELVERKKRHDANRCTYPDGQREKCDWYEAERRTLDEQSSAILKEFAEYEDQKRDLVGGFRILMMKLRVAKVIGRLKEWVDNDVAPCPLKPSLYAAVACLDAAWENHP